NLSIIAYKPMNLRLDQSQVPLVRIIFPILLRCLVALVAFLNKFSRSSGSFVRLSSGIIFSRRRPATCETNGMPYLSRRICPIRLGVFPSLDSFRTRASTSSGSYLNQAGGRLLTGLVDPELP